MKRGNVVARSALIMMLLFACLATSCTHTRRCIDVESQVYYPCTYRERSFSWMYMQRYHSYDEYGKDCEGCGKCDRVLKPADGTGFNPIGYRFPSDCVGKDFKGDSKDFKKASEP